MRLATAVCITALLASSLPGQTLTLTGPATVRRGQTVNVNLSLAGATNIAAWQADFGIPAGVTVAITAGPASAAAGKSLSCRSDWTRCLAVGINANIYSSGVVAVIAVTVPANAPPGPVAIPLSGLVGATLTGDAAILNAGAAYTLCVLSPADLNGDSVVDVLDLQLMIQEILGGGPPANDQNGDGVANVRDVQIVARAAVGP